MSGHKASIIATVSMGLICVAAAFYIHFDTPELDVTGTIIADKVIENSDGEKKQSSVNISELFITPVDTKMPTTFYTEISNTGLGKAENFEVLIDFGESTVGNCEWTPSLLATLKDTEELSVRLLQVSSLNKDTSLYVICSTNLPYFKKLSVGGGNVSIEKSINYDAYKEMRSGEKLSFYNALWRVILIVFCCLFFFKLVGVLFD
jgi:hypothetical protein